MILLCEENKEKKVEEHEYQINYKEDIKGFFINTIVNINKKIVQESADFRVCAVLLLLFC